MPQSAVAVVVDAVGLAVLAVAASLAPSVEPFAVSRQRLSFVSSVTHPVTGQTISVL